MDIELIDRTWACLPKEFKEEVKEIFRKCLGVPKYEAITIKPMLLDSLFGHHNLTSDEEGEDMLICEKSKVQRAYNTSREIVKAENPDSLMYSMHTQIMCVLENIFGSKCLPEEDAHEDNFTTKEPQPAEQREDLIPPNSGELESQETDKQFNTIIKDSSAKERRLNIAAQIVASMVGSDDWTTWRGDTKKEIWHNMAKSSLEIVDALIDECKKGGIK